MAATGVIAPNRTLSVMNGALGLTVDFTGYRGDVAAAADALAADHVDFLRRMTDAH